MYYLLGDKKTVVYGNGEVFKLNKTRSNFKNTYIDLTEDQDYYLKFNWSSYRDLDGLSQLDVYNLPSTLSSKSYSSQVYEKANLILKKYQSEFFKEETKLSNKRDLYLENGDIPKCTKLTDSLRELWKVVFIPNLNAGYITMMKTNL